MSDSNISFCSFIIYGRDECPHTQKALLNVRKHNLPHQYQARSAMIPAHEKQLKSFNHNTVPAIFLQCKRGRRYLFIGGCEEFLSFLKIFGLN